MSKIIIGLSGPIASGKGVSKKYLENKYNAKSYRFSTALRDILDRLHLPLTRNNLQNLSLGLRKLFGNTILSQVISEDIKNDQGKFIVIDGVRRLDDIDHLQNLKNFFLIGIDADEKIRYKRMLTRNENFGDNTKSYSDFINDTKQEAEQEILTVMSQAKYHIDNNGSLEDLHKKLDKIIIEIKK